MQLGYYCFKSKDPTEEASLFSYQFQMMTDDVTLKSRLIWSDDNYFKWRAEW